MPLEALFSEQAEVPVDTNVGVPDPVDNVFAPMALEDAEETELRAYLERQAGKLGTIDPQLGADFRNEITNMLDVASILKGATDGKDFSTVDPRTPPAGGIAINMLTPKDLEQPAGTTLQRFDLAENQSISEGSEFYWWGGDTASDTVSTTDPDDGDGYLVYIIDNGLLHEGPTPITRQLQFNSDDLSPDPFIANPLDSVSVLGDRALTRYETNGSYFINWQEANNLRGVATRDVGTELLFDAVGIVVYEEGYYNTLNTWTP